MGRIRSNIHLIGGGPGTLAAFRRHIAKALPPPVGKKPPLVAYVGAASGDDAGFMRMVGDEITRAGGRVRGAKLASPAAKVSGARALLEDCDLVFVSGGDVEAGMRVLRDRGVLPLFKALGIAGRPMVGLSAGSIMLGRAWVHFPDEDATTARRTRAPRAPRLFSCLGLAPVYADAHAEEDRWAELRVLLRLVAAKTAAPVVGYGLTQRGGIQVVPGEDGVSLIPFGGTAPRFLARGGRVVEARPLARAAAVSAYK